MSQDTMDAYDDGFRAGFDEAKRLYREKLPVTCPPEPQAFAHGPRPAEPAEPKQVIVACPDCLLLPSDHALAVRYCSTCGHPERLRPVLTVAPTPAPLKDGEQSEVERLAQLRDNVISCFAHLDTVASVNTALDALIAAVRAESKLCHCGGAHTHEQYSAEFMRAERSAAAAESLREQLKQAQDENIDLHLVAQGIKHYWCCTAGATCPEENEKGADPCHPHTPCTRCERDQQSAEVARLREENDAALALAIRYGGIDGGHHKAWVIDQMVRALTGERYAQVVADAKSGEDGPDMYSWDEGIAP